MWRHSQLYKSVTRLLTSSFPTRSTIRQVHSGTWSWIFQLSNNRRVLLFD